MSLYSKSRLIFQYESFALEITFQQVYNDIGRGENKNELK